ncbi:MAG: hypothetical protein F6K24_06135 [Okeania sp. SIO2D1]|nr:hypothetical protein [Okeania sp. SIO2D1]
MSNNKKRLSDLASLFPQVKKVEAINQENKQKNKEVELTDGRSVYVVIVEPGEILEDKRKQNVSITKAVIEKEVIQFMGKISPRYILKAKQNPIIDGVSYHSDWRYGFSRKSKCFSNIYEAQEEVKKIPQVVDYCYYPIHDRGGSGGGSGSSYSDYPCSDSFGEFWNQ